MPYYQTHLGILDESAALHPTATVFRIPEVDPATNAIRSWHSISYAQFRNDVEHVAKYWTSKLTTQGIQPNSVIGLWLSGVTYVDTLHIYGVARAGYIPQLISLRLPSPDVIHELLLLSGGKALIHDPSFSPVPHREGSVPSYVAIDAREAAAVDVALPPVTKDTDGSDILAIFHTSGSTSGRPKLVPCSYAWWDNMIAKARGVLRPNRPGRQDVMASMGSLCHMGQSFMLVGALQHASCTVQFTKQAYSSDELMEMISQCDLNRINIFPTFFSTHLRNSRRDPKLLAALRALDQILVTGLKMSPEDQHWVCSNSMNVLDCYASTEVAVMMLAVEDRGSDRLPPLEPIAGLSHTFIPASTAVADVESGHFNLHSRLSELIILADSPDCPHVSLRHADGNYHTGDLFFEISPRKYIFCGRDDDWIKTENSLRCDTRSIEDNVFASCSDLIGSCVVVGNGRPSPVLFVEPAGETDAQKLKNEVYRRIRAFHSRRYMHERIPSAAFIVVLPKGSLPLTATKGNIRRRAVEQAFKAELDRIHHGKSRSPARTIHDRKDYLIGICFLLIVVILWTSSNFVTQGLFEDGYEKPFLVTYLNTSAFSFYLLPFIIRKSFERFATVKTTTHTRERHGYEPLLTEETAVESLGSVDPDDPALSMGLPPLTIQETVQLAASFCFLWFIANWTVNASLDYTSVASATILSSMSGFFTLGIGRIFRVEKLTVVKCVVLVSVSDSSQPASPSNSLPTTLIANFASAHFLGDCFALLSAIFYALYVILLKVRIRSESRIDMQLFFGFVGLFNILGCWPIGVVLHLTGIERFELPSSSKAIIALLINMAITLSSDYIYVLAMLKTTPVVVTIGLSLTMPLAVLGDFFLARPTKVQVIIGAAVVLCSFVLIGLEDSQVREEDGRLVAVEVLQDEGEVVPKKPSALKDLERSLTVVVINAQRRRSQVHDSSVKLAKRQFAVQDAVVEHVELGTQVDTSGSEILKSLAREGELGPPNMKKKEKQALKHELFMKRLESSRSPYSKSHERRLKRKAREQVASGMDDIRAAISAVEDAIPSAVAEARSQVESDETQDQTARSQTGRIGEGKGVPLSKSQRKRALQLERMRIPMILATPEFASNPFQTIRTHAQNTLLRHEPMAQ
ncbi:uncharacterized protein FIBRA_00995 [Fibroporia radiculosa]|uniref:Ribosome biogenesis protein SLX9 n=1 Tax=Fibroporia radiculosa TaxID=599839 RepID=J4HSK8_9APHY|nr:uncharacterized protein FIBRA_00995 [Fibroporia radiculosa]CCL98987.1 predicted protein [Fibroporia radiculosa]